MPGRADGWGPGRAASPRSPASGATAALTTTAPAPTTSGRSRPGPTSTTSHTRLRSHAAHEIVEGSRCPRTQQRGTCRCCSSAASTCSRRPWREPGRGRRRRARSAWAGTARRCSARCPRRAAGRHRPRPAGARARRPSGWRASATASRSCTPCTTRSPQVLADLGLPAAHGVLFDLGVSSLQLDEAERGFAYRTDAPLDMRMDSRHGPDGRRRPQHLPGSRRSRGCCASTARSGSPAGSPTPWCASGRWSRSAAARRLVELVRAAVPGRDPADRRQPGEAHVPGPAHRGERRARGAASSALPAALGALAVGGRIVVMSYHSLEDRIAKRALAARRTQHRTRGTAGGAAGARRRAEAADARRGDGRRRRGRRQPPCGVRAPARSGAPAPAATPAGGMSPAAARVARAAAASCTTARRASGVCRACTAPTSRTGGCRRPAPACADCPRAGHLATVVRGGLRGGAGRQPARCPGDQPRAVARRVHREPARAAPDRADGGRAGARRRSWPSRRRRRPCRRGRGSSG